MKTSQQAREEKERRESMDKFWMVLVDGTHTCSYKHSTLESARIEAERLLRLVSNQGRGATILEAVEHGVIKYPPVEWSNVSECYQGREIEGD